MIIPARNIPHYLHTLVFPLTLKAAQGDQICGQVDRDELLRLIDAGEVVAIGSFSKIKYLRLNTLTPSAHPLDPRSKDRRLPVAEDDRTFIMEALGGGVVYGPHFRRCASYSRDLLTHAMQCTDSGCTRCAELRHARN